MEAPEENGTQILTLAELLEEFANIEKRVKKVLADRENLLTLYEHAQRELALALIRIEELEGKTTARKDDEEANRYA